MENSGGFQVWKFMVRLVLPRAYRYFWGGVMEEHQERVEEFCRIL